jgi:hypothetical protein
MYRKYQKLEEGQVNPERRMAELQKDKKNLSEVTPAFNYNPIHEQRQEENVKS